MSSNYKAIFNEAFWCQDQLGAIFTTVGNQKLNHAKKFTRLCDSKVRGEATMVTNLRKCRATKI